MTPEEYIGSFNPNDDPNITKTKQLAKDLIAHFQQLPGGDKRRTAIACTKIEEAAMMATKGMFS